MDAAQDIGLANSPGMSETRAPFLQREVSVHLSKGPIGDGVERGKIAWLDIQRKNSKF